MASLDTDDDALHRYAVEALAAELQLPVETVARCYFSELAALREGAKISDYLVVLSVRQARDALRGNRSAQ